MSNCSRVFTQKTYGADLYTWSPQCNQKQINNNNRNNRNFRVFSLIRSELSQPNNKN